MKSMKKLLAILLIAVLALTMTTTAFAANNGGTITVKNATKGEKYTLYKIFDAEVNPDNSDAVVYLAPDGFEGNDYFEVDENGFVTAKVTDFGKLEEEDLEDLLEDLNAAKKGEQTANGTAVTFTGLDYGYYYVTSGLGSFITIDTNNEDRIVNDKNTSTPEWHEEDPEDPGTMGKTILTEDGNVEEADFNFGDTVTFQIKIDTVNFVGDEGEEQITSYLIGEVPPAGLEFVEIKSVTVNGTAADYADTNGGFPIKVQWVENDGENFPADGAYYTSLYPHGALLTVTYTATVLDTADIDGEGNVNTASFNYKTYDPEDPPTDPDDPDDPEDPSKGDGTTETDTATVDTFAIAVLKVDPEGNFLSGAQFSVAGLQTTGSAGVYEYTGATANGGTDTVMDVDSNGALIIKGVKAGTYSVSEEKAPAGYNPMSGAASVSAVKTGETTTSVKLYLDEDGKVTDTETEIEVTYTNDDVSAAAVVVVNRAGTVLPTTGSVGTTMILGIGAVLFMATAIILVTKKRMYNEG